MDAEIFFRSTESGNAWYVWLRSAGQAYLFSSLDNARRFVVSLGRARNGSQTVGAPTSLEQAATLI